jgi:hypothetical protein
LPRLSSSSELRPLALRSLPPRPLLSSFSLRPLTRWLSSDAFEPRLPDAERDALPLPSSEMRHGRAARKICRRSPEIESGSSDAVRAPVGYLKAPVCFRPA